MSQTLADGRRTGRDNDVAHPQGENVNPTFNRRTLLAGSAGAVASVGLGAGFVGNTSRPAFGADNVVLVDQGQPRASVLLPASPTTEEQWAADKIIEHLREITGATLPLGDAGPVVIRIGRAVDHTFDPDTNPESHRIAISSDRVDVSGPTPLGTQHAAYELIRSWGVRWFLPGEFGQYHPQTDTLDVQPATTQVDPPIDFRTAPQFYLYAPPPRGTAPDLDLTESSELGRAHLVPDSRKYPHRGLGGHGIPTSPKANKATEPELFVLENGVRTGQLDVTHPEVATRAIRAAREIMAAEPDRKFITMSPNDGMGFGHSDWDAEDWDPLIGTWSVTDRYVRFFNVILADLQQDWPDIGICFFTYINYMRAPVNVTPNPRILPMFAPITIERMHSVADPAGWERRYLLRLIQQWRDTGVEFASYPYLYNLADPGTPFSPWSQIQHDLPAFHAIDGMRGLRAEPTPEWGYDGASLYGYLRFPWAPEVDPQEHRAEFLTLAYGPAAAAMGTHLAQLEQAYADADFTAGGSYDLINILTPAVWTQLEASLAAAEAAAASDPAATAHVALTRKAFDFGTPFLAAIRAFQSLDFAGALAKFTEASEAGHAAINTKPVAIYPYRAQYINWFWKNPISLAVPKTTGDNTLVVAAEDEWEAVIDNTGAGVDDGLFARGDDAVGWRTLKTRSLTWSAQGLRYLLPGGVWYRQRLSVPSSYAGRKLGLWLGIVDSAARVWVNGNEATKVSGGALGAWDFDISGLIAYDAPNTVVVHVQRSFLNELGTGGIMGPGLIYAGAAAEIDVVPPAAPAGPSEHAAAWDAEWRELALVRRKAPTGTRLGNEFEAILDPAGNVIEVGLWEPEIGSQHWLTLSTVRRPSDQGLAYYRGGIVYRQRLRTMRGEPTKVWLARPLGAVSAWLDGEAGEVTAAVDGTVTIAFPRTLRRGDTLVIHVDVPTADTPGLSGLIGPVVAFE
ncbi:DUF4838 domain-containing protein [Microlunatus sp. Y2014]|uniref:DUF4838 domain-containing protein n=1 Tax=Microlunatus sp. Y2014 TaxID=3418488 RepID=UPI003DA7463B